MRPARQQCVDRPTRRRARAPPRRHRARRTRRADDALVLLLWLCVAVLGSALINFKHVRPFMRWSRDEARDGTVAENTSLLSVSPRS